jgi:flagellar basal-body rod protein FlgF/flagellar basal-body rod protein FlgG
MAQRGYMDSGLYAAYTGLLGRMQALDTVANNLANASTPGFRAQQDYFRSVLSGEGSTDSQVGQAVNNFGVLGGNVPDFSQGQLMQTGNPLDLALDGQGFFMLQTKDGTRYTRDGSFQRSNAGQLVTQLGEPVLDSAGKPITVPSGNVHVAPDGTISVAGAVIGKIAVVDFAADAMLTQDGTNRFAASPSMLSKASLATVHQGALEGANEDAIHGTMHLILVQRQAEMMQKALSVFDTDFDKTAAEEIPKV